MTFRLALIGLLISTTLLAAGCGDGPAEPTPTPEPTADGTIAPVPGLPVLGQAPQDLEFVGLVNGIMTEASTTCAWFRGTTPENGRLQVALDGLVNGERHRLRIVINGYTGPGPYDWDGKPGSGPEVSIELDSKERGHATVNVDSPGGSGDIEGTLTSPNQGRIHGLWECPGIPR